MKGRQQNKQKRRGNNILHTQYHTQGEQIMVTQNDFAMEQLENRLEMLWIYVPYIGTCSKKVLWWTVYYPCLKWRWIWV